MRFLLFFSTFIALAISAVIGQAHTNAIGLSASVRPEDALVWGFQDCDYGGNEVYLVDDHELDTHPTDAKATCWAIQPNWLSSIKFNQRADKKEYMCILYADNTCKGDRFKGTAIASWLDTARWTHGWNDKTQSIKCFMGHVRM